MFKKYPKFSDYLKADPKEFEKDLMAMVPNKEWIFFGNTLVWYGRRVCPARVHSCAGHPLSKIYPEASKIWPKK